MVYGRNQSYKKLQKKIEKQWRKTKKQSDPHYFKSIKNEASNLMKQAKCDFYTKVVNDITPLIIIKGNYWQLLNIYLIPKRELCPNYHDMHYLANEL